MEVFTAVHMVMMLSFHYNFVRTFIFVFYVFNLMGELSALFSIFKFQKNFQFCFSRFKIIFCHFCYTSLPCIIIITYCSWRVDSYHMCLWSIFSAGGFTTAGLQDGYSGLTSRPSYIACIFDKWQASILYV